MNFPNTFVCFPSLILAPDKIKCVEGDKLCGVGGGGGFLSLSLFKGALSKTESEEPGLYQVETEVIQWPYR